MCVIRTSPGPDAARAFRLGILASIIIGLTGIALLYLTRDLPLLFAGYVLVLLFPIYLVFAATALSVWLGYDKDMTPLPPVYRQKEASEAQK